MSALEVILNFIAPHDCLSCGNEGKALCNACVAELEVFPARCYRCHSTSQSGMTCSSCANFTPLSSVRVRTVYRGIAKDALWRLKSSGARALATDIARSLSEIVPANSRAVLVPVPTATSRARQRGFDQTRLLCKAISRVTGIPRDDGLARLGQTHQVGSSAELRQAQAKDMFRVRKPKTIKGACVILVDDVITTGATLESAAKELSRAGAKTIDAIVFAQAKLRSPDRQVASP